MRINFVAWLLLGSLICPGVCAAQDVELWKARAGQIPIGATVKLRTNDGQKMRAVLMAVDESGILVKPATRVPESSRRVAFDRLDGLDRFEDHVSFPKYIGIGAAIAGSVFLTLLLGLQASDAVHHEICRRLYRPCALVVALGAAR